MASTWCLPFFNLQGCPEYGGWAGFDLFEDKAEVLGIGKTGHSGDFFDTEGGVDQKIRCVVNTQNLQILDGGGLVYLIEIAAELGVRQIGNPAQGGNRHLRIGKMLVHIVQGVLDGQKRRGVVNGGALLVQLRQNGVEHGHTFVVVARAL